MECGEYEWRAEMARGPSAVGLQLKFPGERGVPLALAARVPRQPARAAALEPPHVARGPTQASPVDVPFMSDMDEISYWIYTKRAPCLMNYDNLVKKQSEEAQCSKSTTEEAPSPRKRKKKRKRSILDEESVSTEQQQMVYFEVSQRQNQPALNSCESDSLGSDVDFNIKNTLNKPKKAKLQKNNRAKINKKPKVVTSTPKPPVNLRRSLRQAQQSSNNVHLNNSYEMFNPLVSNGHAKTNINSDKKTIDKVIKSAEMFGTGDANQTSEKRKNTIKTKSKTSAHLNGQFDDLSDVSGFTANYIRSTKVQSSKTPKKLRCKSSRNLAKESQQHNEDMVVCVNKSMNTGVPGTNLLNCSTDSSQNIINLVTTKTNDKTGKLDKTTSLLKFVDTKGKSKEANKDSKQKSRNNLNVSFQSQSSAASRYPKRYKNHTDTPTNNEINTRARSANKNCLEYNNSDKKENPGAVVTRTRSGRNISLAARQRENSVLVVSNSTEQVSSMVSMNVAEPTLAESRKRRTTRQLRSNKPDKTGNTLVRDSLRDKSGFSACFSESDDDSVPLGQRKYFCN